MKVVIMQPYLFPYLGYWQMIALSDIFVLFDDVNYIKRGWINRNNILLNNQPHLFTLPLLSASQNKKINEIYITNNNKEKLKLLKMFECAYKKAPFFNDVYPMLHQIIMHNQECLSHFLMHQFQVIFNYLGITSRLVFSSEINKNNSLKAQAKILDICKTLNATQYINAIGGQMLYNKEEFNRHGIILSFIKMRNISYRQFDSSFVPYLSMIDILMFNNKSSTKKLLTEFDLL